MSKPTPQELEYFSKLSDEDLLNDIWQHIPSIWRQPSPSLDMIRECFYEYVKSQRSNICKDKTVREAWERGDEAQVLAAIADALGTSGWASAVVGIVRYGLAKLCEDVWDK